MTSEPYIFFISDNTVTNRLFYVWLTSLVMSGIVEKKQKMSNFLEQLKKCTTVVADTGDFEGK